MPSARKPETAVEVETIETSRTKVNIVGTRPLICNRMSEKARRELLLPRGRRTTADRQSTLKHNPYDEFRDSPYKLTDSNAPTYIALMTSSFKGAMLIAALDLPGAQKTQIGRLVSMGGGDLTPVYGEPRLMMSVTRSADIKRTPDIRSRVIVPKWACQIEISFVVPLITLTSIGNLITAAGITAGVGDWRPEKGKGTFGQFKVVEDDDPELAEIMRWDRRLQEEAMADPAPYDNETEELLSWFDSETKRRGRPAA